jgi:hypothetical protein
LLGGFFVFFAERYREKHVRAYAHHHAERREKNRQRELQSNSRYAQRTDDMAYKNSVDDIVESVNHNANDGGSGKSEQHLFKASALVHTVNSAYR